MRFLFLVFLLSSFAHARPSRVIPVVAEAARLALAQKELALVVRPELRRAHGILKVLRPSDLRRLCALRAVALPPADRYDAWIAQASKVITASTYALQALRLEIVEPSDDWTKDDIYAYFFVTNGVIPSGRVSGIYAAVGKGEGFYFSPVDRQIFPAGDVFSQAIENHLIVDYGIVESDGDDVRRLQRLSSVIVDLAVAVYATQEPAQAARLADLRREVKALAEALLSVNRDDRLISSSFGLTVKDIEARLGTKTYVELKRRHHHENFFDSWDYRLTFRLLRN